MNRHLTAALLFITFLSFGQKDLEKKANSLISSDNFQTLRLEKFFIHTNKSIYFTGESIWFKAYVVNDDTNLPALETTNLYINLYDPDLNLISSDLFYVENGLTNGEINLPKAGVSGTYYLQLDTEWNRNFKTGTVFNISIENLSSDDSSEIETEINAQNTRDKMDYSSNSEEPLIKFFPESQTLLDGIQNMVVFSTKKNTKGLIIDDATGKPVASFKSDNQGIGAFKLLYNSSFSAAIEVENEVVKVKLPVASKQGFVIHKITGNYDSETVNFELNTNEHTLKENVGSQYFAVLHRNGSIKSVAPIEFKEGVKDYKISFFEQDVFNGINTVTLFNEDNQPVSERHFYWKTDNIADIQVTKSKQEGDSLNLNLLLLNKSIPANLSISVLPKNTKLFNDDYSILSSFLISPYIDNIKSITNPNVLPNNMLDFYIQAHVVSDPLPYKRLKKDNFTFKNENGITLKGTVNTKEEDLKGYQVMLTSKENNLLLVQPLNSDKTFEFNELLLMHPTKYQLSLLDKKGEIKKGNFFVFNSYTSYKTNPKLKLTNNYQNNLIEDSKQKNSNSQTFDLNLPEYDDLEELDEIVIKADKVREDQETQKKLRKTGVQGVAFSRIYEPSKSSFSKGDILQYLRTIPGLTVKYTQDNTPYINNERYLKTLNNIGDAPFSFLLDGAPSELDILNFRQASEFEYIIVNFRGAGFGALYPKGVISFITKKGENGEKLAKANPDLQINDTQFGFNLETKRYQNPIFQFPSYSAKENYRTLDWIPNYTIAPNIYNTLKVNIEDTNGIKLIINGLSTEGDLIYQVIDID